MNLERREPRENGADSTPASAGAAMRAALERTLEEPCPRPLLRPSSIPDHVLLQRIGTGAYGDVWMARSTLGSLRAIKVVYRDRFDEERPFQREFHGILKYEPISRSHPGLVGILHVGRNQESGYFYYVMELADPVVPNAPASSDNGPTTNRTQESEPAVQSAASVPYSPRTLRSELAKRRRLPPVDAASLTLNLAGALEQLHSHDLVHRDIKPSNVIFVGGEPKLADIGLVTGAGDSRSFVGTEGFIAPEGPGTPVADLYGLGKLLYELATGRDRMDFPQLPVGLDQFPEREALLELNEVITRACAPKPQDRYGTASQMAADLKLFLAGHSLRYSRKQERHLAWLKQFAMAACLAVFLAFTAVWFAGREAQRAQSRELQSRQRAELEQTLRHRAEAAEHQARQQLYSALFEQARSAVRTAEMGHRMRALEAISRAAAISNNVELRRVALCALALPDLRFERELPVPAGATLSQLDRRFERLAVCVGDGPLEIRSTKDNRLLQTLPASAKELAFVARWSADGRFLAVKRDREDVEEHADVEVWEVETAQRILLLTNTPYGAFDFHPFLSRLLVGTAGDSVETWDAETRQVVSRFTVVHAPNFIIVAPDGERVAVGFEQSPGWTVTINLLTNGMPLVAHRLADRVDWLDWHPSGDWLAAPDLKGLVNLLNTRTGQVQVLGRHKAQAVMAAFSPDGSYLISGGWEREMVCWDMRTLTQAFSINLNSFLAQFRGDGKECAIASKQSIRLYAFEFPSAVREFSEDLGGRIRHALFSPDGHWFAAAGHERLGVWDLTGRGLGALLPQGADARLYFSSEGHDLFASGDQSCFHWRLTPSGTTGRAPTLEQIRLDKPEGYTSLAAGSNVIAFTTSRGSQVVPMADPAPLEDAWKTTIGGVNGLSATGRWLGVYRPFTSLLELYGLPDFKPVGQLKARVNLSNFEFSPIEDEVAVSSPNGIEFWSTETWQRTREITNYMGLLYTVDGSALWLTQDYRTAALCDARTIAPLLPLPVGMLPLAVSADGRYFAVSLDARRLQVWDLAAIHNEFRKLGIDWNPVSSAGVSPVQARTL